MRINAKELRIVFMGTPDISAGVLKWLIDNKYNVVGVIAQPDRPVGRKNIIEKVPTKKVAESYNIPVFQPIKIRKENDFLSGLNPDLIITLAYGQIVPESVLNAPKIGCLNLHGSLLPKYRGAAPIQYSLINNDKITGMSLMKMVKEMDAGEVYATEVVEISEDDNSTSLFEKMMIASCSLLEKSLDKYVNNELIGKEQDVNEVTFCPTIKSEQEKLDLSLSAKEIYGWIRGLSDEPGAYLNLEGSKVKIFKAKLIDDQSSGKAGEIIQSDKNGLVFQTINGKISILELQKAGKNRMEYKSFVNGNQNLVGKIFD